MRGFRVHLEEYRPLASSSELDIIEFLLERPDDAVGISTHRLAELTYTSPSTVVRLVRKLGFSGYPDFQRSLVYDRALAEKSRDVVADGVITGDATQDIIDKVTSRNVSTLELTRDGLEVEAVDKTVDLIRRARRIALFGVGASLLVAHDLQLKLLRLDISCEVCDDLHSQLLYANNLGSQDLAIVVSYSGMTEDVLHCARVARNNGAKVVSITRGSFASPLVDLSDVVLGVAATELLVRSGAMSSRIAQLNVVDVLFTTYVCRNYKKSVERLSSNWIKKAGADEDGNELDPGIRHGSDKHASKGE